jgi:hypothetical protein
VESGHNNGQRFTVQLETLFVQQSKAIGVNRFWGIDFLILVLIDYVKTYVIPSAYHSNQATSFGSNLLCFSLFL